VVSDRWMNDGLNDDLWQMNDDLNDGLKHSWKRQSETQSGVTFRHTGTNWEATGLLSPYLSPAYSDDLPGQARIREFVAQRRRRAGVVYGVHQNSTIASSDSVARAATALTEAQ